MSNPRPDLRASDSDREAVAKALQEHFAQGRLDNDEFNSRLTVAYTAKTMADLVALTTDLPERDLHQLAPPINTSPVVGSSRAAVLRDPALVIPWAVWGGVSGLNLVIWLLVSLGAGGGVYPWWVWVAGPWGAVMLFITVAVVLTSGRREH